MRAATSRQSAIFHQSRKIEQAAWVLGCQAHDVPILVSTWLLKPLGNPPQNAVKFFATAEVLELSCERAWLVKVSNAINQYWRDKNARQKRRVQGNSGEDVCLLLHATNRAD